VSQSIRFATLCSLSLLLLALVPACAADGLSTDEADELASESVRDDGGKADAFAPNGLFYSIRRDFRKCASPMCGGFFIKRVNYSNTKCADGKMKAECYVATMDTSGLVLTDEELGPVMGQIESGWALVRAKQTQVNYPNVGKFGHLEVLDAYLAATEAGYTGTVREVYDNGVRCIAAPCFSYDADRLNYNSYLPLSDVDLSGANAGAEREAAAYELLAGGKAVIIAGTTHVVHNAGPAGDGRVMEATQFWTRAVHTDAGGCGGTFGIACGGEQFCDVTVENACGDTNLPGECKTVPDFCTEQYQPVCGCDGVTYGNDCFRVMAQAQLAYAGECTP
jgi:hypothetical protein